MENETYKARTRHEARSHTVAIADKVVVWSEMRKARAAEELIPGASKALSMGRAVRSLA